MKLLLLLGIVVLAAMLWRSGRRKPSGSESNHSAQPSAPASAQDMVRCHHCGVHLPLNEASVGRLGYYCGAEHRQRAEP